MKRVEGILTLYPDGHQVAAMIPLLDLAQRQYGILISIIRAVNFTLLIKLSFLI